MERTGVGMKKEGIRPQRPSISVSVFSFFSGYSGRTSWQPTSNDDDDDDEWVWVAAGAMN